MSIYHLIVQVFARTTGFGDSDSLDRAIGTVSRLAIVRIEAVLANNQMMNQRHEFHLLNANYVFDVRLFFFVLQRREVLVSCYEGLVTQLLLKVHTQSLDTVAHAVTGLHTG